EPPFRRPDFTLCADTVNANMPWWIWNQPCFNLDIRHRLPARPYCPVLIACLYYAFTHTIQVAIITDSKHTIGCRLCQTTPSDRYAESESSRISKFSIFLASMTNPGFTLPAS